MNPVTLLVVLTTQVFQLQVCAAVKHKETVNIELLEMSLSTQTHTQKRTLQKLEQ